MDHFPPKYESKGEERNSVVRRQSEVRKAP